MSWRIFNWSVDILVWVFTPFARFVDWRLDQFEGRDVSHK